MIEQLFSFDLKTKHLFTTVTLTMGRCFADSLSDLRVIVPPKTQQWPAYANADAFIQIYDWDHLNLGGSENFLEFPIYLGLRTFPSTIQIYGPGKLMRTRQGSISCLQNNSCYEVSLTLVDLFCMDNSSSSILIVQGTFLNIINSSFSGCSSDKDGSILHLYDNAKANITQSTFLNLHSFSSGGAISAVGSSLLIVDSQFSNCSSELGGGSVWISAYQCYGNRAMSSTYIDSSDFDHSSSKGPGGAIYVTGQLVAVTVMHSTFNSCLSESAGGAISISDMAELEISASRFENNVALGLGGGALHVQNASLYLAGSMCKIVTTANYIEQCAKKSNFSGNSAPVGGGGALFLQGSNDLIECAGPGSNCSFCIRNNSALYGSCVASDYKRIQITQISEIMYPGIDFSVVVTKMDAYNHTIYSDSSSILEVYSVVNMVNGNSDPSSSPFNFISGNTEVKMQRGKAVFSINIQPTFSSVSFEKSLTSLESTPLLYFKGIDSQTMRVMHSEVFSLPLSSGKAVCPPGYVLSQSEGSDANGSAVCAFCKPGTYSLDPLAPAPGSHSKSPSCFNCPAGGNCLDGGGHVNFSVGVWVVSNAMYVLRSCPQGHQLVNSSTSSKVFSHDLQECLACPSGQYIVSPNSGTCQNCPKGAVCLSDLSCALRYPPNFVCAGNTSIIGEWSPDYDTGIYILNNCPAGYELVSTVEAGSADLQECRACLAGQYIIDPSTDICRNCPAGIELVFEYGVVFGFSCPLLLILQFLLSFIFAQYEFLIISPW